MSQLDPGLARAFHGGGHYENFPVASWLLPKNLRPAVLAFYRLARTGDDLADEGELTVAQRLQGLDALRRGLMESPPQASSRQDHEGNTADSPSVWPKEDLKALEAIGRQARDQLKAHGLTNDWALQLLKAFEYDAQFEPFATWPDVMNYCQLSAAPVGRILLGLFGLRSSPKEASPRHGSGSALEQIFFASDSICTGLQLINFGQDLHQDVGRHRPTFPRTEWPEKLSWQPDTLGDTHALRKGVLAGASTLSPDEQITLTRSLVIRGSNQLARGEDLPKRLYESVEPHGLRLALEISMILEGGQSIAQRLLQDPSVAWRRSIRLSRSWLLLSLVNRLPVHLWRLTQSTAR